MRLREVLLPVLLLAACEEVTVDLPDVCVVDVEIGEAVPLVRGEPATLAARPMSATFDTRARVGGLDAFVEEVARTDCLLCDSCRADNDCQVCGTCEACDDPCAACQETVTLVVDPALPAGPTTLVIFNRHGVSDAVPVQVVDP